MRAAVLAASALAASAAPAFLPPTVPQPPTVEVGDQCPLYGCTSDCGRCFNPGARPGVVCKGQGSQTGYYCPAEMEAAQAGDVTFACMDWSFGSSALLKAESDFSQRTGDAVYLGVGTYGTGTDPQSGLGACYRLKVDGMDRDIIAQSINTGHDVSGDQFDLQMGGGGVGAFNNCAGADASMFPGGKDAWGCQYGGIDKPEDCDGLPMYPRNDGPMKAAGDSLPALCKYSWEKGVRLSGVDKPAGACKYNPTLLDVARVKCPEELVQLTWMQRSDEPEGYKAHAASLRSAAFPNADRACHSEDTGSGTQYCLTRMMDCRKPSGAFKDNVKGDLMVPGRRLVQTCTADGYTRIDVQCGCQGCYC